MVNLISIRVMETIVKIKIGKTKSDLIAVLSGLGQDGSMSPIFYNLVWEQVIREMKIELQEGI